MSTTRRGSSKIVARRLKPRRSKPHSGGQGRGRGGENSTRQRWQQPQPAFVAAASTAATAATDATDPHARGARRALRPAALAKADAARARQEGLPRRARRGGAASLRSERSSVVVCYDPKSTRVVDLPCNQRAALYDYSSILPRACARSRSCVTLHPPSPRRGDPRADQLDDVRALERARPPAERADPLEAGAARAGAVVEHDARDAGRAQLVPRLAAEGRAVRRAGRVADRAAVSHQCL